MSDILKRIKRAVIAGNVEFTLKATLELDRDDLLERDVIESILTADAIDKTIRSTSASRSRSREYLHVIVHPNLGGLLIYSKGKLVEEAGIDRYYVLVSAKRAG